MIVEVGNKADTRFWWTPERIFTLAPMAPSALSELDIIAYGAAKYHPFARWCYERYLSPDIGTAILAYPATPDFETFPFELSYEDDMRARFATHDVAIVTFYDARFI